MGDKNFLSSKQIKIDKLKYKKIGLPKEQYWVKEKARLHGKISIQPIKHFISEYIQYSHKIDNSTEKRATNFDKQYREENLGPRKTIKIQIKTPDSIYSPEWLKLKE